MFYLYNSHKNHSYARVKIREKSGNPAISKLAYFFHSLLESGDVGIVADKKLFPDNPHSVLDRFNSYVTPIRKSVDEWQRFNNLTQHIPIKKWGELDESDVVIITAKDLRYSGMAENLRQCKCRTLLLSTNHYCHHPDKNYEVLSEFKGEIIPFSEMPVSKKPIYRDYLPANVKEVSFGYAVEERFQCKKSILERSNPALITGSISAGRRRNHIVQSYLEQRGFMSSQGYREALLEKFGEAKNIKSLLSLRSRDNDNSLKFKAETLQYYKYDLVSELNNSAIFICPPDSFEVMPQLFFEAIACGCVVLTNPDEALTELGFECGKHYLGLELLDESINLDLEIEKLFQDKNKLMSIQKHGLSQIQMFRKEEMSKKVYDFLKLYN